MRRVRIGGFTELHMTFNFSPHPITEYALPGLEGRCEAGCIARLERSQAVWNLFWMSVPNLDRLPGRSAHWSQVYTPIQGAAAAVTTDVVFDEVLYRKLLMHPIRFADWFEREDVDASIYESFQIFGDSWKGGVLDRARQAGARMAQQDPMLKRVGNVYPFLAKKAA